MLKKLFAGLTIFTIAAIVGVGLSRAADPSIVSYSKFSDTIGGFEATLDNSDAFGSVVVNAGDIDNNGVNDLAVGVPNDDDGGSDRGAVYILFFDSDGTLSDSTPYVKFSDDAGGFEATLDDFDGFGNALAAMGDLNGDGVPDLAVGADDDDDGGAGHGAVYILYIDADGSLDDSLPYVKFSDTAGGFTATLSDGERFGEQLANMGDLNSDGTNDLAVGVPEYGGSGSQRGGVFILFLDNDGTLDDVTPYAQFTDGVGGFPALSDQSKVGIEIANIGDINGDGTNDLLASAYLRETVYVLFLDPNGTLDDTIPYAEFGNGLGGGLEAELDAGDYFGTSIVGLGDVNGDGTNDIAVGAPYDDDGGSERGAVYILFLDPDGSLDNATPYVKFSDTAGGFEGTVANNDRMGLAVESPGDLDGNEVNDLVFSYGQDGGMGASRKGEVYVLFLENDGTLVTETPYLRIADGVDNFDTIDSQDVLGANIVNIGDVDSDGTNDLVLSASGDGDGGTGRGAVYLVLLDGGIEAATTPTSPNPPSAFTFGIADTGTCTWDPNIYLSVKGSNLAQVIVSDNLRFVGAQVLPYTPNNGSTVLPDHLSPVDNTMYIAFKLPSYATGVDPATGEQIAIPLYGPYSVYAVGRSGSGNITSIQADSITFSSSEDCTYPYEVILEDDTGNGSEEGNEGTTPEDQDPLIPVERHQIISLSANMNDLTNEFYLVDTAADGSLVKRPDPRVTNYDISFSWLNKGYSFLSVNQRTLDSLPTAHAMLPEGPAILKFTEGSQNYFYIPSDNSAPREITTANLANELFLGTNWQSSVWILGPEVPSSSVPHGRTIPRYDVAIVRDWRNNR